jgi:hypothetical protein
MMPFERDNIRSDIHELFEIRLLSIILELTGNFCYQRCLYGLQIIWKVYYSYLVLFLLTLYSCLFIKFAGRVMSLSSIEN